MESLLNFCKTFRILEEVVKCRLEKEVPTVWRVYSFFSFTVACCALNECLVLVKHRQGRGYLEVAWVTFRALVKPQHILCDNVF